MRNNTRAALAAAPLSLALLLAACGSDDSADPTTTTTTTTEATTSSTAPPASSETTAPPTGGTTPPETAPPSQAGDPLPEAGTPWAAELVRAWGAGDRDRAAELATAEVVDQLFGHAEAGGEDWALLSCDSTAGSQICTFTSAARAESVMTTFAGDTVTSVAIGTADPDGVTPELAGLADSLVQAWGAGDREEAARYASPTDVGTLFGLADPGGTTWERTTCVAIDDDPQCVYRSPDHEQTVILHVSDDTATPVSYVFVYFPS
jgi:hypothetical protein